MPKLHIKKEDSEITLLDENLIQEKLDDKLDTSDAFSGSYNDLTNKPSIPSKISDLIDDSDFVEENELSTVATTGDYDDLVNKPSVASVTVIEDISEITSNGLYILKEIEPVAPQLKLVFKDGANYGGYLYITTDPTETSKIYLDDGETLTVDWGDGNITTYTNEDSLEQEYSFATSGEHTVTFDFSNCSIPTLEQSYAFEDYRNNILEVYYPYGLTMLEDLGLSGGKINIIDIPITVEDFNVFLMTSQNGVIDVYWTNANDIPPLWGIADSQKVRIPTGTTAIYEATNWNNNGKTIFIERGA